MKFQIKSSNTPLNVFSFDSVEYTITRAYDMSNAYVVSTRTAESTFGVMSPEGAIVTDRFVGLVTWISNKNEFAFSLNPEFFLPFHVLIPEARKASTAWLDSIREDAPNPS